MDTKNFGFTIQGIQNKDTSEKISELNMILNSFGIRFDATPYEQNGTTGYFNIRINMETLEKKKTRNAGRKRDYRTPLNYNLQPKIGEVFEWKKNMTHEKIIEKIGCPRAIYYRRLREISELYGVNYDSADVPTETLERSFF